MQQMAKLLALVCLCLAAAGLKAAGRAEHVVVVVWDGMRPDFVNEGNTPTLFKLAQEGVTFTRHHPVYVSSTEVNGAALATGVYPEQSGVIGNSEFRPAINPTNRINTAAPSDVRRGDELTGNHFLAFPTVAETLHRHGLRTAIAGAKTVTLLHDRFAGADGLGTDIFEGNVFPTNVFANLEAMLGKFPPIALPKARRDLWTTRALTGPLWEKGAPPFSLLWLSEPDYSQHWTGPGSETSLAAIKSSDENLGRVLAALEQRGLRENTDLIIVSDHSFSTIGWSVDVAAALRKDGFQAGRSFAAPTAQAEQILVVGNGGTVFLYLPKHDRKFCQRVVNWLQAQPFCGVIFTKGAANGTFQLKQAKINSRSAPDIVAAMRWTPERSTNGTPGLIFSDYSEYGPGQGMHASLSPFDMHNTCIAAGPDFRKGFRDTLPTGNIDIGPTVLWLLGVKPEKKLSGRVLREALSDISSKPRNPESRRLRAVRRAGDYVWRQYLDYSEVGGVLYLDAGNGELIKAEPAGNP
jgi:arylsulfatase A-like enzyme